MAIVIIAFFYTGKLSYLSLIFSTLAVCVLILLNVYKCMKPSIYICVGICLWVAVLKSGVHATLAGIILAMSIPDRQEESMLSDFLRGIHPWVVFLILPLFAFANAGVSFADLSGGDFSNTLFLGITLGLFLGKQFGVFIPLWYFFRFKHYLAYEDINLGHIYGVAVLCGVGFTMSLFIGSLAFKESHAHYMPLVRMGVLIGSLLSGLIGYGILRGQKARTVRVDSEK